MKGFEPHLTPTFGVSHTAKTRGSLFSLLKHGNVLIFVGFLLCIRYTDLRGPIWRLQPPHELVWATHFTPKDIKEAKQLGWSHLTSGFAKLGFKRLFYNPLVKAVKRCLTQSFAKGLQLPARTWTLGLSHEELVHPLHDWPWKCGQNVNAIPTLPTPAHCAFLGKIFTSLNLGSPTCINRTLSPRGLLQERHKVTLVR